MSSADEPERVSAIDHNPQLSHAQTVPPSRGTGRVGDHASFGRWHGSNNGRAVGTRLAGAERDGWAGEALGSRTPLRPAAQERRSPVNMSHVSNCPKAIVRDHEEIR